MRTACETYFNGCLSSIKDGMGEIAQKKETANLATDFGFDLKNMEEWNCRLCKQANHKSEVKCRHCNTPRPKLSVVAP